MTVMEKSTWVRPRANCTSLRGNNNTHEDEDEDEDEDKHQDEDKSVTARGKNNR